MPMIFVPGMYGHTDPQDRRGMGRLPDCPGFVGRALR
jgi:hypothetical protein